MLSSYGDDCLAFVCVTCGAHMLIGDVKGADLVPYQVERWRLALVTMGWLVNHEFDYDQCPRCEKLSRN